MTVVDLWSEMMSNYWHEIGILAMQRFYGADGWIVTVIAYTIALNYINLFQQISQWFSFGQVIWWLGAESAQERYSCMSCNKQLCIWEWRYFEAHRLMIGLLIHTVLDPRLSSLQHLFEKGGVSVGAIYISLY